MDHKECSKTAKTCTAQPLLCADDLNRYRPIRGLTRCYPVGSKGDSETAFLANWKNHYVIPGYVYRV